MRFKEWIVASGGGAAVARKLGVTRQTVNIWLRGTGSPTALMMVKIVRVSRGVVSYADIIAARKKGARR